MWKESGKKTRKTSFLYYMKDHVSELGDCPNTIMSCVFKDVGCDVTVKRHEMEQHLTTAVVEHQIKQHQIVKALRDENKQIKETLHFVNSALIQLFSSQSEDIVSYCGKAIVRFAVSNGEVKNKTSKHFFVHSNGYKVALRIWSMDGCLCAALIPVHGDRDRKLRWPFILRHTITLVGQQHHEDTIKMTIDPVTLDKDLVMYCFHGPNTICVSNDRLNKLRCKNASLCVSESVLFTEKYVKNEAIVVVVEVDT
ncbi:uncharacterized protein LOC134182570 isoform X2 [Corticium candelabrum]|uniref:uncharacterized protein LOC134182570 isoform X2 n=1 Tax=Corticium candelabrum TaxID=121492 RepID=UPI002E2739FC|nr:uncharacterized protein LOC134182570 isoform X2 [Corticium candelabrum]